MQDASQCYERTHVCQFCVCFYIACFGIGLLGDCNMCSNQSFQTILPIDATRRHSWIAFYFTKHLTVKRAFQYWLDKSTIHVVPRWIGFTVLLALFFLRVYLIQGFFIVAYGLGIYLLNNFIAFLSPLEEPSTASRYETSNDDGLSLPGTAREGREFRPFARRLPEFKFWLACTRGCCTCLVMTFFSIFDVPVFWPILLLYFFVLFFMTMKRQILHMYKHKYVPISFGKAKYKDAGVEHGAYGGGMSTHKGK